MASHRLKLGGKLHQALPGALQDRKCMFLAKLGLKISVLECTIDHKDYVWFRERE